MYIRGAKGQELIPNIEFWKDLPQLVKVNIFYCDLYVKNTWVDSCRQTVYNFIRSGALVPLIFQFLFQDGCLFTVAPCCHRFQTSSYAELSSNTS